MYLHGNAGQRDALTGVQGRRACRAMGCLKQLHVRTSRDNERALEALAPPRKDPELQPYYSRAAYATSVATKRKRQLSADRMELLTLPRTPHRQRAS